MSALPARNIEAPRLPGRGGCRIEGGGYIREMAPVI
jgi:hypothetical protein